MTTRQKIEQALQTHLKPSFLELQDESAQHAGHAGAMEKGGGHYRLVIVSEAFLNLKPVERHRLVYQILQKEMKQEIHALAIRAYSSEEYKKLKSDS